MFPIHCHPHFILLLTAGMLTGAVLIVWWGRIGWVAAGWNWGNWRSPFLVLGWGCLLAIIGVNWLRYLIETHRYLPIPIAPTPFDWLALVLVLPLAQEVLFRGAILSALQRSWHPAWAVLLTAACSVVLLPLQSWLAFVFLCSIGYALVFRGAGTVLAPTAAHALVALTLLLARMHPQFLLRVPADDWIKFALVSLGGIILGSIPGRRSG